MTATAEQAAPGPESSAAITPFTIDIPQADLDDLRQRLANTRWAANLADPDWAMGVDPDYARDLVAYWRDGYDWRAQEARLNQLPQFMTTIDGQPIHFLHVRSEREDALPLLLLHGWPGSILEFRSVIDPLAHPGQNGGQATDAFHLVIPALPGFGFSGPTREGGWSNKRIARAMVELMTRLGYDRFGVQGGDFGAVIAPEIGLAAPEKVVGLHVNAATAGFMPPNQLSAEDEASLSDRDREAIQRLGQYMAQESGYMFIQSTKPQTLGFALADSPVGQLAWIVEKFKSWSFQGTNPFSRDDLLTNVMLYWLTNTAASSARLYRDGSDWESWGAPTYSPVPVGVARFAEDVAVRRFAEQANNIIHWTDFDRGGHFAAMEAPDLFVDDVRAFFRPLR